MKKYIFIIAISLAQLGCKDDYKEVEESVNKGDCYLLDEWGNVQWSHGEEEPIMVDCDSVWSM